MEKELRLVASDENLPVVLEQVEELLVQDGCDAMAQMQLLMAAEELFVNIAHYAYEGQSGEAVIKLCFLENPHRFCMVFRDKGVPYNPLEHEDPDITLSAEDRQIGGLGIYLIKQTMDSIEYTYEEGENVLKIEKFLE